MAIAIALVKFHYLIGLLCLCTSLLACDGTHHSRIKRDKDALLSCIGDSLTEKQTNAVRQKINADHKAELIQAFFNKKHRAGFNGSVLVAQNGVVLFDKQYGYAHLRQKDTLTAAHTFQLASLSKPFTALAVLQLAEDNKLSLEDSVQKFFPKFPYRGVTVKSLLSHRSGLPNYMYTFPDSVSRGQKYPSNQTVMNWFEELKPVANNRPERGFSYNNSNYLVLGAIIEKVSKLTFEEYMKRNLFEPLEMHNTFLATSTDSTFLKRKTVGHQYGRALPKDYYDDIMGDKGIYSTTADLYKFYKGLAGGCIIEKKLMKEAYTPRSFERKGVKNYGYGFRMHLNQESEPKYIYHGGWWKGYNTMFWMGPEHNFVIIVLSNSYNKSVYQIKDVIDILHGEVQNDDIEKDI